MSEGKRPSSYGRPSESATPRRRFQTIFFVTAQSHQQLRQKTFAAFSGNGVQR
jgi:hypothetical protein